MSERRQQWKLAAGAVLPTAGLALFPKCPMCLAAYGAVAGSVGTMLVANRGTIMPLLGALAAVCLGRLLTSFFSASNEPSSSGSCCSEQRSCCPSKQN